MTKNDRALHWSNHQERTVLWGMRFLFSVYRLLGRLPFLIVLGPVILFYWISDRQLRHVSFDYLCRAYRCGLLQTQPSRWMTLRHLMFFAETILDKMVALSGNTPQEVIRVDGEDHLARLVEAKRGGVVLTSHMGCIEALQAYANHFRATPIYILVHTKHSQSFNRLLNELNPLNHLKFIEVSDITPAFAFSMQEAIDAGALLFIAGDRVPVHSQASVEVDFLGSKAAFPIGGPILAGLFHCPLVQMTCLREKPKNLGRMKKHNRYRVRFQLLSEAVKLDRRHRQASLAALMALYAKELEWAISESPYDWFNFFPFWQSETNKTS